MELVGLALPRVRICWRAGRIFAADFTRSMAFRRGRRAFLLGSAALRTKEAVADGSDHRRPGACGYFCGQLLFSLPHFWVVRREPDLHRHRNDFLVGEPPPGDARGSAARYRLLCVGPPRCGVPSLRTANAGLAYQTASRFGASCCLCSDVDGDGAV